MVTKMASYSVQPNNPNKPPEIKDMIILNNLSSPLECFFTIFLKSFKFKITHLFLLW